MLRIDYFKELGGSLLPLIVSDFIKEYFEKSSFCRCSDMAFNRVNMICKESEDQIQFSTLAYAVSLYIYIL